MEFNKNGAFARTQRRAKALFIGRDGAKTFSPIKFTFIFCDFYIIIRP